MMHEDSKFLVDDATQFDKSLQELRELSSQLYHSADYCETTFLNAKDKRIFVETTKEYISRAVVTVVDHLGSISAKLESCLFNGNSIPVETEHKIDSLKQRIVTCQHYSQKLDLTRFYGNGHFSRYHRRYISPPLNSEMKNVVVLRNTESPIEPNEEFASLVIRDCKPYSLFENSTRGMKKNNKFSPPVLPVRDGLSISTKTKHSYFHFQEAQKRKGSMMNWKNRNIKTIIWRGKRILAQEFNQKT